MQGITQRLTHAIRQAGLNPSSIATKIGLTPQAAQKWKKGQISLDSIIKILDITKADANWLLLGETPAHNHLNNQHGYIGGSVSQSVTHQHAAHLDSDWLAIASNDMHPMFIIGDKVRIDAVRTPVAGDYVLAKCDGLDIVRKWRPKGFDANGIAYTQLIAENEDYPIIDSRHQDFTVLGVVVQFKRTLVQRAL